MAKRLVAIDPGKDGGIAVFVNDRLTELHSIPQIGDKVDHRKLSSILHNILDNDTFVIIEEVHAIFGASAASNFSFGHINGFLLGTVIANGCPYTMVQPRKWQSEVWITQDKVYKSPKSKRKSVDTKATSLLAAKRLFPKQDFRKSSHTKKFHDGLIDAALIGKYWIQHGTK